MIASDKDGEHIAFGTTVPFITTATPVADIEKNIKHLISRVVASHVASAEAREYDVEGEGTPVITLPVPIYPHESDHLNKLHTRAVLVLGVVIAALDDAGFTVMSCTPVAMGDDDFAGSPEGVAVGYMVYAATANNAERVMDSYGEYRVAGAWTDRASNIYGEKAIEEYRERMSASMESMLRKLAGETEQ